MRSTAIWNGLRDSALDLAQRNWKDQKEVADARILLEAARAARDPAAAKSVLDWMQASKVEDVALTRLARDLKSIGGRA